MKALLVVDVQKDFCPGGSLAVPNGDEVAAYINKKIAEAVHGAYIFSFDCHPDNHCSFVEQGGPWPKHCVAGTKGFELHDDLKVPTDRLATMIFKGMDLDFDSYSAFADDGGKKTELEAFLKAYDITELDVVGLATEYCVKFSVLDGLKAGLRINVLMEGCRGLSTKDINAATQEMMEAGAFIIDSEK